MLNKFVEENKKSRATENFIITLTKGILLKQKKHTRFHSLNPCGVFWVQDRTNMCGIVGIFGTSSISMELYYGLRALQHRGQSSSGLITFDGNIYPKKDAGVVSRLLKKYDDEMGLTADTPGPIGIGQTRYSTSGGDNWQDLKRNAQPEYVVNPFLAACHNGNIYNGREVLSHCRRKPRTDCDIQCLLLPMAEHLPSSYVDINFDSIVEAGEKVMDILRGSYSALFLTSGKDEPYLVAMTDPHKIRPLVVGQKDGRYYFASESSVLTRLGVEEFQDVDSGTIISVSPREDAPVMKKVVREKKYHCMFEYVYFADPNSWIEGRSVHHVRVDIGKELARHYPVDADVVVPVPESGRRYALGFSHESGIPLEEGLKKDKKERAFILQTQEQRDKMANTNLVAIRAALEGKEVVLTDDSLVRGTNITRVIAKVQKAGARKVHVRIGCPPIIAPCFFGIDMRSKKEFIAIDQEKGEPRSWDAIARRIGADSLAYGDMNMLRRAILKGKGDDCDICTGCINFPDGYPPDMRREIEEMSSRAVSDGCRVYEP